MMSSNIAPIKILLLGVLLITLSARIWLLDERWINPDEGAHLMDATLVLEGKVPKVDFDSRQPFYVLVIAGFLKVFGQSYIAGRLVPLTCSLLTGLVLFFIGKRLFDEKAGAIACAVYWILPIEIFNSVVVKTEPLVILLTSLSFYGLILALQSGQWKWIAASGAFAGLGFYVRESSIIIPAVVFSVLVFRYWRAPWELIRNYALFLAGYVVVFAVVMLFYSQYMVPKELVMSSVSPLGTPVGIIKGILAPDPLTSSDMESESAVKKSERYREYSRYLKETAGLHAFLLIGLVFFSLAFGLKLMTDRNTKSRDRDVDGPILLLTWMAFLTMAYWAFYMKRGFFIDYSREFLPPLTMMLAGWLREAVPMLNKKRGPEIIMGCAVLVAILLFAVQAMNPHVFGRGYYASITIVLIALMMHATSMAGKMRTVFIGSLLAVLGLVLVSRSVILAPFMSGTLPSLALIFAVFGMTWFFCYRGFNRPNGEYLVFIGTSIIGAAFVVSIAYSAVLLNLRYDSPWSPQAVEAGANLLRDQTVESDEVMSGGVIWEFQASRMPFQMISHPLSFMNDASYETTNRIRTLLEESPPKAIVLDGFTEKTYLRRVPTLLKIIQERYELALTVAPAKYPVQIYIKK